MHKTLLAGFSALCLTATVAVPAMAADAFGPVPTPDVNEAKAALGKRLFFDPRLSGDAEISCSSCHQPDKGFTDGMALSDAYPGNLHFRNTPTLINTAQRERWFHDGRLGTNLNDVTRESITETYLMNMDMRLMQERIKQDPVYVEMFNAAGLGEPSNGGVRKAIPEYLKTLVSKNAPYDTGKMDAGAKRGEALFMGKAQCSNCHNGSRFTDDALHVTGVQDNPDIWSNPQRHITFVTFAKFQGLPNYMNIRQDPGGQVIAMYEDGRDIASFLTPTLRELKYTAPYMHNGAISTLEEVVDFYNNGGGDRDNKDPLLKPLGLTGAEKADLVSFLNALSGDPLTGPDYVPEEFDIDYIAIKNWRETTN